MNEFNFVVEEKSQKNVYVINNFKYEISNVDHRDANIRISVIFTKKNPFKGREAIFLAIPGKISHVDKVISEENEFQFIEYVEENIISLDAEKYETIIRDDLSTDSVSILELGFENPLPSGEKMLFILEARVKNIYKEYDSEFGVILEFSNYLSTKRSWHCYPLKIRKGEIWVEIPMKLSYRVDPAPYIQEHVKKEIMIIAWLLSRNDFQRSEKFCILPELEERVQIIPSEKVKKDETDAMRRNFERFRRRTKILILILAFIIVLLLIIINALARR